MEPPILGLLNPKKNAALYHGLGPPIYEMDGPTATEYQNQKVFCSLSQNGAFMKWPWVFHVIRYIGYSIP